MTISNPLLAMFASEPALVAPEAAPKFEALLRSAEASGDLGKLMAEQANNDDGFWPPADSWYAQYRPYVVRNGILIVPIKGVLLHDFPWQYGSYATGYDYIWRAVQRGLDDGNVHAIALVLNTPGGMVAGCFELVDRIFARRGEKPIRAFAHEMAYSAGYAIASVTGAKNLTVSRTGGVGSIGVVTMHVDVSKALDHYGYKITFISAPQGGHKTDGNSYEPLPDDVKARIQERIDELYGVFVSSVARNRGMDEQAIRDTKALTFTATQAVSNGLADAIGPLDDALSAFADDLSSDEGDEEMSDKQDKAAGVDQAAIDSARAEGHAAGVAEGRTAGATAERERISAILGSDEAKGRTALASHFAMKTDMSPDAAKAALAAAPVEAAAPAPTETPFNAAAGKDNPNIGADAEKTEQSNSARILAARYGTATPAK